MKKLHVADNLLLPTEAVTQTFALLARRGAGKTYAAKVLAEEMLGAGFPIVALDPTGAWWGLRAGADGDPAGGFPVVIMGGAHADVPLEPTGGKVVADFLVNERVPTVLDLSGMGEAEMQQFVADLAERFYRTNTEAVHWFVDEADEFAPQDARGGGPLWKCLGAMQRIVRRGRIKGIGCTLITQRSAVLNKSVLTQSEVLVAMQTTAPQDLGAVAEWLKYHSAKEDRDEILHQLPGLQQGQALVYSPGWLRELKLVTIRPLKTFDSSRTPKPGEKVRAPKGMADVDLAALQTRMAATVEKAKAEDPRELRKRIAELERQLRERPAATETVEKIVEVPVLKNGQLDRTEKIAARVEAMSEKLVGEVAELRKMIAPASAPRPIPKPATKQTPAPRPVPVSAPRSPGRPAIQADDNGPLTGPEQRILDALAWLESIGVMQPELPAVAFLAGYTTGGGAFNNPRGKLRSRGLVEYLRGNVMVLTDEGRRLANQPGEPLTTEEMHRRVLERLPGPEQKILGVLLAEYPKDVDKGELAQKSGYSEGGGAFNNPCGRLRTLGLIDYPSKGRAVAMPLLFPE